MLINKPSLCAILLKVMDHSESRLDHNLSKNTCELKYLRLLAHFQNFFPVM